MVDAALAGHPRTLGLPALQLVGGGDLLPVGTGSLRSARRRAGLRSMVFFADGAGSCRAVDPRCPCGSLGIIGLLHLLAVASTADLATHDHDRCRAGAGRVGQDHFASVLSAVAGVLDRLSLARTKSDELAAVAKRGLDAGQPDADRTVRREPRLFGYGQFCTAEGICFRKRTIRSHSGTDTVWQSIPGFPAR